MKKVRDVMYPKEGQPYALFNNVIEEEFLERLHLQTDYYGGSVIIKNMGEVSKVFISNPEINLEDNISIIYNYSTQVMQVFYLHKTYIFKENK